MYLKCGSLLVCLGTSFSYGTWTFANVTLSDENELKIEVYNDPGVNNVPKVYHLSSEWFIITPRPTTESSFPPLPENKKQDGLFALTQPSVITIWFLASSKYERNLWIEKILPVITLNPPTPPEPPPPYSEYDNVSSYFPWDLTARPSFVEQNSFTLPRPSIHSRSGFYSLEKPIKRPPKPVEPLDKPHEPPPLQPSVAEQPRERFNCVNCFALGCAFICDTLSTCLQMCCTNFGAAF